MQIFKIKFTTKMDILMAALDILFIIVWIFILGYFTFNNHWIALLIFGLLGIGDIRFRWNRINNVWGTYI